MARTAPQQRFVSSWTLLYLVLVALRQGDGTATCLIQEHVRLNKEPTALHTINVAQHHRGELTAAVEAPRVEDVAASKREHEQVVLHRMQWWASGSKPLPPTDRYLLFTMDPSAVNNIRIGLEMSALVAQYTERTFVLPPAKPIYLLDWGRRVTGFLPKELEGGQTTTAIEDLINVQQLKTVIPTLTWEEFYQRKGLTLDQAIAQSGAVNESSECDKLPLYKTIDKEILFMNGETPKREGFSCGEWWARGGPKQAMRDETGGDGFALLTHGLVWHEDAFRIASKVVNFLGIFDYVSLHARYNDFEANFGAQPAPQMALDSLSPWLGSNTTLYIASDEPAKFAVLNTHAAHVVKWADFFENSTGNLLADEYARFTPARWFKLTGLVEELICTFAKVFVGTDKSSFTGHIQRMRIHANAPDTSFVYHSHITESAAQAVTANITKWNSQGGSKVFTPLPRNRGNVFLIQNIFAASVRRVS